MSTMITRSPRRMSTLLLCLLVLLMLPPRRAAADDEQVWAALKQGGKVILLRHTHVDIRQGIGHLAHGNCAEEVNLSPHGVEQAKRIGEAFHALNIAVGEVLSSPYCRCIETGKLAFGRATPVLGLVIASGDLLKVRPGTGATAPARL